MEFATHLANERVANFLEYFDLILNEILYFILAQQTFIEATESE